MMLRRLLSLLSVLFITGFLVPAGLAQTTDDAPTMESLVPATPGDARIDAFEQRQRLVEASLVNRVPLENIGPTIMSGRVVDVDVSPTDPTHFYVAYASGGLWKTTNNGQSFTPLFQQQASMTLGDIAVDWDDGETIWVGTGENNSSRSSYAGTGVYKSTDGGETWQHLGLTDTERTGRLLLHPDDPQTAWVAAAGALYSESAARGLYKTTDGGQSWTKTLSVDDRTGIIDLEIDHTNPEVLYAAAWERARRGWNFVEGGDGSGIYKSTDGGDSWSLLTTEASGFPTDDNVGRIGLALHDESGRLYAYLDNQERRPEDEAEDEDEEEPVLTEDDLRDMSRAAFLELSEDAITSYLDRNNFPASYTAESVLEMVREGEIEPVALVEYLHDANAQLFDTPVVGPQVFTSTDGGQSWTKTHDDYIDDLFYSYGYYFGEIRVAPDDPQHIYILGVPMLESNDGGTTWSEIGAGNVHVDHHALWVSPDRPGHLINGNDGGINISYDDGETWFKANTPPVGQFYAVQVDQAEPYNVYGGLQDNGVWMGPHTYDHSYRWYAEGDYPYDRIMGGDGMQIEVDTRTNDVVYTGFQFGNYYRINRATDDTTPIQPQHDLGERPYRFQWTTPIHLSRHNQDILYLGSQYLHRSMDQGDSWTKISPDLTAGGQPGNVPFGTLTTIDESPFQFGLLYTGSDDGRIHVTKDGGSSWTRIDETLPQDLWVSRVEASRHDTSRVYATLNGYTYDHFESYVYRSDDYGATWTRIGTDLPAEPVNVVLEDPAHADILYVGTDHGLYLSLDRGDTFMAMDEGLPDAPVHDLKIQQREQDLIVGTHGRSIFRADLEQIQQLPDLRDEPLHVFAVDSLRYNEDWGTRGAVWMEADTPSVTIPYFAGSAGPTTMRVTTEDGTEVQTITHDATDGLNDPTYDLSVDDAQVDAVNDELEDDAEPWTAADNGTTYLGPGTYTLEITHGDATETATLKVLEPRDDSRRGEPHMERGVPGPSEEQETK
jgi:photosystem II stability/assembly factor-like uncharacterized protein